MRELVYPRLLLPRAERFADKVGFIDVTRAGTRYSGTFATHVDRVLRLSDALRQQLDLARDDRYGVLAMNGHEFIELYHAALFGAGIINPLNIRFSAAELAYVLHDSGTTVIFTDPVFATLIQKARDEEGAKVDKLVIIGGTGDDVNGRDTIAYEDLMAAATPVMPSEPDEQDPVILMYTGGTTGLPKGALLDQRAEVLNLYHVGLQIGLSEKRRFLFQSPMFHAAVVAGVIGIPASGAVSVTIPLFDPELVLDTMEEQRIDTTMMVPRHDVHARAAPVVLLTASPPPAPAGLRGRSHLRDGAFPVAGHVPQGGLLSGLRDDRGGIDPDLPRTRRAPSRRRHAECGRRARFRCRAPHHRCAGQGAPARGGGRGLRPRGQLHDRLLGQARGHRREHARRVVPHR